MVKTAVYPGTFDPMTKGHVDIITRVAPLVKKLIIGVATNSRKKTMFSIDSRVNMVKCVVETLAKNVEVMSFEGLLVDFAKRKGATTIIRGLRAVSDFESEFQMAAINRKLASNIETLFLMSSDAQQFISSHMIKEIYKLGGDVSQFVDDSVMEKLKEAM